jgi:hypothetical protein
MQIIFLLHLTATSIMAGVIWVIQLLHYPYFHHLHRQNFTGLMQKHRLRISFIVIPVMLIELLTGAWLMYYSTTLKSFFLIGFLMIAAIWLSTFWFQVRAHNQIAGGYNSSAVTKLVKTNWIRTILWTARLILLFFVAAGYSYPENF